RADCAAFRFAKAPAENSARRRSMFSLANFSINPSKIYVCQDCYALIKTSTIILTNRERVFLKYV
ncbi:MAG: hypothetical protein LBM73_03490, partial [Candidatus Nomurabacteria bacterium]|nr:hypothetical protein [Candidatus Nomurabacteria bacterium]